MYVFLNSYCSIHVHLFPWIFLAPWYVQWNPFWEYHNSLSQAPCCTIYCEPWNQDTLLIRSLFYPKVVWIREAPLHTHANLCFFLLPLQSSLWPIYPSFSITDSTVTFTDSPANPNNEHTYDSISVEKNAAYESNITHDNEPMYDSISVEKNVAYKSNITHDNEPTYNSISLEENAAYESNIQIVTHDNVAYEKPASFSGASLNSDTYAHKLKK